MPTIDMSQIVFHECIKTGARTVAVENEIEDTDDDPGMPPGWARVTIERVVLNPDAAEVEALRASWVERHAAVIPADQRASVEGVAAIETLREQARSEIPDEAPYEVQRVVFCLSPAYVAELAICDDLKAVLLATGPAAGPALVTESAPDGGSDA